MMRCPRKLLLPMEFFLLAVIMYLACVLLGGSESSVTDEAVPLPRAMELGAVRECEDKLCLGLLSREEKVQYDTCYNRSVSTKSMEKFGPIRPGTCRFQNGSSRFPVGLGSFQGSGNTWLRGLLQKVTGICTGSLYCDGALRTKGFTGEGVHGESVIAIKSHSINPLFTNMEELPKGKSPVFGAALLLIRNPRNAMVAEWHRESSKRQTNRNVSNHVLFVGKEYFRENPGWNSFVVKMTDRWKRHTCGWLMNGRNNPLCVVKFEDLQDHTLKQMVRIISFFGGTTEEIATLLGSGYNSFHRNHTDTFNHFTPAQESYVKNAVEQVIAELTKHYTLKSLVIKILQSYLV